MPRLFLALLLGIALPAQALTFQTRMENVEWTVDGDKFECRLSQKVDGYGEAMFVRRAGERPVFELSAWSNLMRPGPAQLFNDAPPWRPGTTAQVLGSGIINNGPTVLRLPYQQAGQMLAGLSAGLQPTIQRGSISDAGQITVVVSSVGYRQAWDEFQVCASGLLPMNIDQISRSAIGFPSGGAELDPQARQMLDVALAYIEADSGVNRIQLDGHSDASGDRLRNRELSRQRVLAVQGYLVERGVDEELFINRFHGERYPVVANSSAEGRAKNRRVTLRLERE
ncbi:flagellar protein MotY [Halopseudomonas bauzanensis]|uniref:OmpA family protein n=1 Tax=Halopseudomonas bauzanensis TaxID=653930 RepID=A0A4U0YLG8_9GAMM|nr:OmpA family protein [Halopseudomonas bauzanensis]TKA91006.1 OmpA family protein [Halopseudomonas bauzanensis]